MTTPRIHRFDFSALRDFRGTITVPDTVLPEVEEAPPAPPPPPVFSEQELDAARLAGRKQGYSEGFAAGEQEAKRRADQELEASNAIIATLGESIASLDARYKQMLLAESRYLSALVLAVARKVAGDAIQTHGEAAIYAIIDRCMPVIFSKPRLIIELHPDLFERTLERIESHLRDHGFEGEVQFKANAALGPSDVNLDWGAGQANHSAGSLWAEVESLIERVPLELTFAETLTHNQKITGE